MATCPQLSSPSPQTVKGTQPGLGSIPRQPSHSLTPESHLHRFTEHATVTFISGQYQPQNRMPCCSCPRFSGPAGYFHHLGVHSDHRASRKIKQTLEGLWFCQPMNSVGSVISSYLPSVSQCTHKAESLHTCLAYLHPSVPKPQGSCLAFYPPQDQFTCPLCQTLS